VAAAPSGASYSPACDFQDADQSRRVHGFFARAPPPPGRALPFVAQFTDRSLERRTAGKDSTERSMKFSSSRIFPGQCQLESFLRAAARNGFDLLLHAAAILLRESSGPREECLRDVRAKVGCGSEEHVQADSTSRCGTRDSPSSFPGRDWSPPTSRTSTFLVRLLPSLSNLTFLQSAQQFGLDLERNIPGPHPGRASLDQRVQAGQSFVQIAPVKAPRSCPKSSPLEQSTRNRGAIEFYKGPLLAPAAIMDRAGDQFPFPYRFSPRSNTVEVAGKATVSTRFKTWRRSVNSVPTIPSKSISPRISSSKIEFFPELAYLSIQRSRDRQIPKQHCSL